MSHSWFFFFPVFKFSKLNDKNVIFPNFFVFPAAPKRTKPWPQNQGTYWTMNFVYHYTPWDWRCKEFGEEVMHLILMFKDALQYSWLFETRKHTPKQAWIYSSISTLNMRWWLWTHEKNIWVSFCRARIWGVCWEPEGGNHTDSKPEVNQNKAMS